MFGVRMSLSWTASARSESMTNRIRLGPSGRRAKAPASRSSVPAAAPADACMKRRRVVAGLTYLGEHGSAPFDALPAREGTVVGRAERLESAFQSGLGAGGREAAVFKLGLGRGLGLRLGLRLGLFG